MSKNLKVNVFAIMQQYETFNSISKKTLIFEKDELSNLIDALETMVSDSLSSKQKDEIKYRFTAKNGLEFGRIFNETTNVQEFYMTNNSRYSYKNKTVVKFNTKEIKRLIKILKKVEKEI